MLSQYVLVAVLCAIALPVAVVSGADGSPKTAGVFSTPQLTERAKANAARYPGSFLSEVQGARARLEKAGLDWRSAVIEARYAWISEVEHAIRSNGAAGRTFSEVDAVVSDRGMRLVRVSTWPGWWPRLPFLDARIRIQPETSASAASP
jgi:hypothetical protein